MNTQKERELLLGESGFVDAFLEAEQAKKEAREESIAFDLRHDY